MNNNFVNNIIRPWIMLDSLDSKEKGRAHRIWLQAKTTKGLPQDSIAE